MSLSSVSDRIQLGLFISFVIVSHPPPFALFWIGRVGVHTHTHTHIHTHTHTLTDNADLLLGKRIRCSKSPNVSYLLSLIEYGLVCFAFITSVNVSVSHILSLSPSLTHTHTHTHTHARTHTPTHQLIPVSQCGTAT